MLDRESGIGIWVFGLVGLGWLVRQQIQFLSSSNSCPLLNPHTELHVADCCKGIDNLFGFYCSYLHTFDLLICAHVVGMA